MKIVVDTNIVFSAILNSQSHIGQILLRSDVSVQFFSPQFLQYEIQKHMDKIQRLINISDVEVFELIHILYTKIHFISEDFIPKNHLIKADELTKDIDFDDVLFVALSLHLKCRLWTGDKSLTTSLKQKGFKKFISTQELLNKLTT